jgi:hypothetical protein
MQPEISIFTRKLIDRGFGLDDITLGGASVIGVHDNTERRAMVDTGVSLRRSQYSGR